MSKGGRSFVDHIVTFRIILKQVNEFQKFLYLVFIDYKKAYDLLKPKNLRDAREFWMKSLTSSNTYRVLYNGVLFDPIRVAADM